VRNAVEAAGCVEQSDRSSSDQGGTSARLVGCETGLGRRL